jgi:hypothetical protein
VFAHKTTLVEEPGRAPVDPQEQVEARARAHFDGAPPHPVVEDARQSLIRGAQLRIVPDLPGIQCNPKDAEVEWWEPIHEVLFRLFAGPELAGTVVRGAVRVWCGPLIIGEMFIAIQVAPDGPVAEGPLYAESVRPYRKIFPSYSHRDRAIVANFAEQARALGDRYLQDVLTLRSGERWNARLLELIEAADVFQLFWSHNSMRSPHCRDEWEHALELQRPLFVRPVYWEEPLPEDPGQGLPPAALRALHFVKVPVAPALLPDSIPARSSAAAQEQAQPAPRGEAATGPGAGDTEAHSRRAHIGRAGWLAAAAATVAAAALGTILHGAGSGQVTSPPPSTSTTLWAYATGGAVDSSPAVAGGTVYVGSNDHRVYALDAVTGHARWAYATGGAVDSSPAVAGGTVYVGSNDHKVYALDAGP